MTRGERVVTAARRAVGVRFRLHGRDAATGLDCIGLVLVALAGAGWKGAAQVPSGYALRGGEAVRIEAGLRAAGLRRVRKGRPGDVLIVRAGPEQLHMMVAVTGGHVHAHAGLGRVVEMPGPPPWPVIARYRWGR